MSRASRTVVAQGASWVVGAMVVGVMVSALASACSERNTKPPKPEVGAQKGAGGQAPEAKTAAGATQAPQAGGDKVTTAPSVPFANGPFSPSFAKLAEGETFRPETLMDSASCGDCHAEIVKEWEDSMHRFASFNNAIYVASFDDFVKDKGHAKGRFCNGCHEPVMLFGEPGEVKPDDPKAYVGVSCATCHGIKDATLDGNASYTLTTAPIPLPKDGDDASLKAHLERVAPLREDALCVSCHRGFLSPETGHDVIIGGIDELASWRRSPFASSQGDQIDAPIHAQSCTSCHMPKVPDAKGSHASHRFAGGHTTFAASLGADAQLEALKKMLSSAARLELMPLADDDIAPRAVEAADAVKPGAKRLRFDVVVFNNRVGHHFPGGTRDLKDTWVEVALHDAKGRVLAVNGAEHAESGKERGIHRLRARILSNSSDAVAEHSVASFRTPITDRTIAPRDASVARYVWTLPEGLDTKSFPLKVTARLRHRRIQPEMHARACDSSKTPRGVALLDNTRRHNAADPDPCKPQPILDIATEVSWVGPGSGDTNRIKEAFSGVPTWQRHWMHGLALRHQVQERLDEARYAFEAAFKALTPDAPKWARASIQAELARVLAKQGRTDDATALLDKAAKDAPDHPALFRIRAEANAQVWRWEEAAAAWQRFTELAPNDDRGWRGLAQALGSLGRREDALRAAKRGLILEPRDPHLLRSQSLAISRLAPDSDDAKRARKAWLGYRRDEGSSAIKGGCDDPNVDNCQQERLPVVTRDLKPAP